jgi:N utilization substance protein B
VLLLQGVVEDVAELDALLGEWIDRPAAQLDPIEHAVLWIGLEELRRHLEVPYRVVLNEAVELAKKFGATEGHKFINAVLDRAARRLRAAEQAASSGLARE